MRCLVAPTCSCPTNEHHLGNNDIVVNDDWMHKGLHQAVQSL